MSLSPISMGKKALFSRGMAGRPMITVSYYGAGGKRKGNRGRLALNAKTISILHSSMSSIGKWSMAVTFQVDEDGGAVYMAPLPETNAVPMKQRFVVHTQKRGYNINSMDVARRFKSLGMHEVRPATGPILNDLSYASQSMGLQPSHPWFRLVKVTE